MAAIENGELRMENGAAGAFEQDRNPTLQSGQDRNPTLHPDKSVCGTDQSYRQMVRNFVEFTPMALFTAKQIGAETGVNVNTLRHEVKRLVDLRVIEVVPAPGATKVYRKVERTDINIGVCQGDWKPSFDKVMEIWECLDEVSVPCTIKDMCDALKMPYETMHRYLIIMAYIGAVKFKGVNVSRYAFLQGNEPTYPLPTYQTAKKGIENLFNFLNKDVVVEMPAPFKKRYGRNGRDGRNGRHQDDGKTDKSVCGTVKNG